MRAWLVAFMIALTSSASAADIKVMAAGSLKDPFTAIFADFTRQYGGSFAPTYGPSGGLRERLQKGEAFDVFASAALPHAQALTDAGISGPSILFARNALCAVTEASRPLVSGNLIDTLLKPDIKFGTSTPVSDPAGDYTWEMFHKIDALGPARSARCRTRPAIVRGRPRLRRSRQAAAAGRLDITISIVHLCSGAQQSSDPTTQMVALPDELTVGPEYGFTVSRKAQGSGGRFRDVLMSPQAQATLKSFGFIPVAIAGRAIERRLHGRHRRASFARLPRSL